MQTGEKTSKTFHFFFTSWTLSIPLLSVAVISNVKCCRSCVFVERVVSPGGQSPFFRVSIFRKVVQPTYNGRPWEYSAKLLQHPFFPTFHPFFSNVFIHFSNLFIQFLAAWLSVSLSLHSYFLLYHNHHSAFAVNNSCFASKYWKFQVDGCSDSWLQHLARIRSSTQFYLLTIKVVTHRHTCSLQQPFRS